MKKTVYIIHYCYWDWYKFHCVMAVTDNMDKVLNYLIEHGKDEPFFIYQHDEEPVNCREVNHYWIEIVEFI